MNLCNLMHADIKHTTKREQFLADMESIVPFKERKKSTCPIAEWSTLIEPYYYKKREDGCGINRQWS